MPCHQRGEIHRLQEEVTVLNIRSTRMFMAHGFLRRIFEVFDRYETSVDMVATSEVSVSLTIDSTERLPEILKELREFADVDVLEEPGHRLPGGRKIRSRRASARACSRRWVTSMCAWFRKARLRMNLGFVVDGQRSDARRRRSARGILHANLDPAVFAMPEKLAIVGYGKMGR